MHISICVNEILEFLQIKPGQTGLDATLGYGGHTLEMLKCLDSRGHLYALDVDPIESAKTKERLEKLGFGEEILSVRKRGCLILYWRIWAFLPCRSITLTGGFLIKRTALWICA